MSLPININELINGKTVEIRNFPNRIDIISFPGPLPPLNKEKLKNYRFDVRKYRNRRIGEFLKELHLTEGRQTGIPTILKEIEKNQSPKPVFETDDDRSYFKITFAVHPDFKATPQATPQAERVKRILNFCTTPKMREEIKEFINIKDREYFRKEVLNPLLKNKLLQMTIPDKPSSPKQKYVITEKGKSLIQR